MKLPDDAGIGTREDFAIEKFQLAKQFIKDAHALYLAESNNSAVNRAYYASFKVLTALLSLDGKKFKSHGQSIGYFNYEYVHKKEAFPNDYGEKLSDLMLLRHKSDYEEFVKPTDAKTQEAITFAEEFFISVKHYCEDRMGREIDVKLDIENEQDRGR